MILGVDLTGEERERYEAVRAARIKMERDGTPSPFIRCKNSDYCQAKGISNDAPRIAPKLLEWIGRKRRFNAAVAARELNCCTNTIYRALTYLRESGQTAAQTTRGGGKSLIKRRTQ
jgi:hypothetical protein